MRLETLLSILLIYGILAELFLLNCWDEKNMHNIKDFFKERFSIVHEIKTIGNLILFIGYFPMWVTVNIFIFALWLFWKIFGKILTYKLR